MQNIDLEITGRNRNRLGDGRPRDFENNVIIAFINQEQGYNGLKRKWTGEQRQFWGTGSIGNADFVFRNRRTEPMITLRNKRTGKPMGRLHMELSRTLNTPSSLTNDN